jgi:hypothetical protein
MAWNSYYNCKPKSSRLTMCAHWVLYTHLSHQGLEAYLDGSDGHVLILSLGSSPIVVSQNHDWVYMSKTNIGLQSSFVLTLHFGNKVLAYLLFMKHFMFKFLKDKILFHVAIKFKFSLSPHDIMDKELMSHYESKLETSMSWVKTWIRFHICHPFNFVEYIFVFVTSFYAHPFEIQIVNFIFLINFLYWVQAWWIRVVTHVTCNINGK